MSYKDKTGAWVIPEKQVKEFERGIDYNKLIQDCLGAKQVKPTKQKAKPKKVQPIEIELDLEELEEKPTSFLHRDVRSFFRG